uniref:Reverse transcriptase domain-containing protein n=1 Tax=Tanacetum cinerariifolium TaxID=118510 RepID=A0A699JM34_TANCI|nr:reverse transcriptase domain-containing protein [Tanacetum cinerariifolium]
MAGPVEGGGSEGTDDRDETPPPLTKEQIEGHVSALKSLIKSHNRRNKGDPIRLDFELEDTEVQDHGIAKGKEVMDEDLGKPFKEARRTPLTSRIIGFAGLESKMPTNIKLYDGTTDPEDHLSRFASAANSGDGSNVCLDGYSVRMACFKEPYETTKIVRKANESLTTFKERWMVEMSFIMGVPEVMKISSFMDSVKLPKLAKRFSNKVPTTVNEMMERLDDFVRSEEAYARTELSKGKPRDPSAKHPFRSTEGTAIHSGTAIQENHEGMNSHT